MKVPVSVSRWTAGRATLAAATTLMTLASAWAAVPAGAATATFSFTGADQPFTVPADVTSVHVAAIGGRGAPGFEGSDGGHRGTVEADLAVTPGEVLHVMVGGAGIAGNSLVGISGAGGFNGGGSSGPGPSTQRGGGGGGATDIRTVAPDQPGSLGSRLIVAAGGGGGPSGATGFPGGAGGGLAGVTGAYTPTCDGSVLSGGGGGGTQSAGGSASGSGTQAGVLGVGGHGGGSAGGGGGGGYFGGGGGFTCGGGGGGSGYLGPRTSGGVFATSSNDIDGTKDGSVTLTFTPQPPVQPPIVDPPSGGDQDPPQTRIEDHPDDVIRVKGKARVRFRFSSDADDATFLCALDGDEPRPCDSPVTYRVAGGRHRFEVAARADGATDRSPASFRFLVKRKR